MSLQSAFDLAIEAIDFPKNHPLHRHGDWRLWLRGPWRFADGIKWMAIAEPYNATGKGLDKEIEGIGESLEEALLDLVTKIHRVGPLMPA